MEKAQSVEVVEESVLEDFERGDRVYALFDKQSTGAEVFNIQSGIMYLRLDFSDDLTAVTETGATGKSPYSSFIKQWKKVPDISLLNKGVVLSTLKPSYAPSGKRTYWIVTHRKATVVTIEKKGYPEFSVQLEPGLLSSNSDDHLWGWDIEG